MPPPTLPASGSVQRYAKHRHPGQYLQGIESSDWLARRWELGEEDLLFEFFLNRLRLKEGFSIANFEQRFHLSVQATFGRLLNQLAEEGCLADRPGHCALTVRGMRYHNSISARFAAEL